MPAKYTSLVHVRFYIFLARSAVFEAESEGESEKSEDLQEGSCPVLIDDKESERVSTTWLMAWFLVHEIWTNND